VKEAHKKIISRITSNPLFWVILIIALLLGFIMFFESGYPNYLKNMYNIF